MGNNLTALEQFQSPPNPPTPLATDKYFWIDGNATSGAAKGERVAVKQSSTISRKGIEEILLEKGKAHRRAIPVVYITKHSFTTVNNAIHDIKNAATNDSCIDENASQTSISRGRSRSPTNTVNSEISNISNKREPHISRYTLLYCHGHDVDLGMIYDFLVHMSKLLNVDILSFEYAGYGVSALGENSSNALTQERDDKDDFPGNDSFMYCGSRQEVVPPKDDAQREAAQSLEKDEKQTQEGEAATAAAHDETNTGNTPPTEEQCYLDILTCYNYLVNEKNIPSKNIVLYGKSLGSGPVCWLARKLCQEVITKHQQGDGAHPQVGIKQQGSLTEEGGAATATTDAKSRAPATTTKGRTHTPVPDTFRKSKASPDTATTTMTQPSSQPLAPLAGVILHSAFLSIRRLKHYSTLSSGEDAFDNQLAMLQIIASSATEKLPVYLMHGKEDEVVPFAHGVGLYQLMLNKRKKGFPPFWADGGTHWNIEHKYATAYIKRLQQFLRHCARMNGDVVPKRKRHMKAGMNKGPHYDATRGSDNKARTGFDIKIPSSGVTTEQKQHHQQARDTNSNQEEEYLFHTAINRPSFNMMPHHRSKLSRSNSKAARQRKKKGTLVIRGEHEQEDSEAVEEVKITGKGEMYISHYVSMHAKNSKMAIEKHHGKHGGKVMKNGGRKMPNSNGNERGIDAKNKSKVMVVEESRDPPTARRV
mmetsp:Transcript_15704/g.33193  ORF Transcript_15704/g.33193 Transcript_15704/m.33193 type:complete len:704 (+) Transcript_15704:181-2292(+)